MSKKRNFIVAHDEIARDDLIAAGFPLLEEKDGYYRFANPSGTKINFAEGEFSEGSISYTNKMSI